MCGHQGCILQHNVPTNSFFLFWFSPLSSEATELHRHCQHPSQYLTYTTAFPWGKHSLAQLSAQCPETKETQKVVAVQRTLQCSTLCLLCGMTPGMFELKRKAVDTAVLLTSGIHIVQYTVLVLAPDSHPP